ncbi:globin [Hahella sp. KA22]|uniref:globin n=1 Tax=Hahella sp. KA22 TaxID=1628392 RepID=UPI000FDF1D4E|nr:globin [Hahella sp. KA22]AZZ90686.1 globin [Hahella sp. KA22]QAY54056.1 globin [Hahella sp. KA22]
MNDNSTRLVSEYNLNTFRDSFARCFCDVDSDVRFVDDFYVRLKASDANVSAIFNRRPIERQVHAVRSAVYALEEYATNGRPDDTLRLIEASHNHQTMGLTPCMYELWLSCLLETVLRHDHAYSDEVRQAWELTLRPGIDYLKQTLIAEIHVAEDIEEGKTNAPE